ncbi:MAG: hypothetical protein WAW11_01835 [Patescibacteria group bacterium]
MKKTYIALGALALTIITTVGLASTTMAAGRNSNSVNANANGKAHSELNETTREARRAEMETKRTAVEAAIKANDYNAWVAAVGTSSPMAQKITAANFSRFVEAHNLQTQARAIMTELGLENGEGRGMGMGMGFHQGLEK